LGETVTSSNILMEKLLFKVWRNTNERRQWIKDAHRGEGEGGKTKDPLGKLKKNVYKIAIKPKIGPPSNFLQKALPPPPQWVWQKYELPSTIKTRPAWAGFKTAEKGRAKICKLLW
jgi:hypothetical protein